MNLSRRTLLTSCVAVASATAIGTGFLAQTLISGSPFRTYVKRIIERRLPYVEIDPQTLDQFARDLEIAWAPNTKQRLASFAGGFGGSILKMFQPNRVDWFERKVLTTLLLSSDFFQTGAKKGSKLTYYGIRDDGCSAFSYLNDTAREAIDLD